MLLGNIQKALQVQVSRHRNQFSSLVSTLTRMESLPLLFDLSGYRGCLNDPAKNTLADVAGPVPGIVEDLVPLFTLCQVPSCKYAFPIPTYSTYKYVETVTGDGNNQNNSNSTWDNRIVEWLHAYPCQSILKRSMSYGVESSPLSLLQKSFQRDEYHDTTQILYGSLAGRSVSITCGRSPEKSSRGIYEVHGTKLSLILMAFRGPNGFPDCYVTTQLSYELISARKIMKWKNTSWLN